MVLAKAFPQLKFIIQDREGVVPDGIKVSYQQQILTQNLNPIFLCTLSILKVVLQICWRPDKLRSKVNT